MAVAQSAVRMAQADASPSPSKRMQKQCLQFAEWVKKQGAKGRQLVALWKSTCEPAVMSGTASEKYSLMCDTLGGEVQQFADNDEWTPSLACRVVLRTLRDSGVGGEVA